MRRRVDPLGELLRRTGMLDDAAVAEVLELQERAVPFGSLCYLLGHLDEETAVRGLARQFGVPGAVLERCVIPLSVFDRLPRDLLLRNHVLPLGKDSRCLYVATEHPTARQALFRDLEAASGRSVVPHVALRVTLSRTLRECLRRLDAGEGYFVGPAADPAAVSAAGRMAIVTALDDPAQEGAEEVAYQAVYHDVTSEIYVEDLLQVETEEGLTDRASGELADGSDARALDPDDPISVTRPDTQRPLLRLNTDGDPAPLERALTPRPRATPRILVVDDEIDTLRLLSRELGERLGFHVVTAQDGAEAVAQIQKRPPDAIVIDVILPEIDGLEVCRAVKQSGHYKDIPVVLTSAVVDTGQLTDELLRAYGVDEYFEKPLNTARLGARLRELLRSCGGGAAGDGDEEAFRSALELYRAGRIDEAVEALRSAIEQEPLSAKHHFVLANLLQKKEMLYEAIDEYEATVDLMPDYFPALTRLAYLYYQQGFSAKAIETWRRSLPHCPDPGLRQNIEVFMRKLIAEMQRT